MLTMATEETRHYFQTIQRLKKQYTAWAGTMRATDAYADRPGHTSNDAIGNALFMWAREQDPEELAKTLAPYVERFQKIWLERDGAAKPGTEEGGEEGAVVTNTKVLGKEQKKGKHRDTA